MKKTNLLCTILFLSTVCILLTSCATLSPTSDSITPYENDQNSLDSGVVSYAYPFYEFIDDDGSIVTYHDTDNDNIVDIIDVVKDGVGKRYKKGSKNEKDLLQLKKAQKTFSAVMNADQYDANHVIKSTNPVTSDATPTTSKPPSTTNPSIPITTASTPYTQSSTTYPPTIPSSTQPVCGGSCSVEDQSKQCTDKPPDCVCCCGTCMSSEAANKKSGFEAEEIKDVMKDLSTDDMVSGEKFPYRNNGVDLHPGIDYSCDKGDDIYAPFCATVTKSYKSSSYGNVVIIHACSGEKVLFAHLDKRSVKVGDLLEAGQKIGECGSTGRSEAPHLHIEGWTEDCSLGMTKKEKVNSGCAKSWEDIRN